MTVEEIKQSLSMQDVLSMYGLHESRKGFISCPFHGKDAHPSMKIYKKDYHCFTCGKNGDIFTFVQEMEHCSFKDAFLKLGGTYEKKTTYQHDLFQYRLQKKKEKELLNEQRKRLEKIELLKDINMQKIFVKLFPVYSDEWCESMNKLELDFYKLYELTRG